MKKIIHLTGNYWWISLLSIIIVFLAWHYLVTLGIIPEAILASPVQVYYAFILKITDKIPDGATLGEHLSATLTVVTLGYISAVVIGIPLGLLMGWFKIAETIIRPIFEAVRPIAPIAWIPLAILILGIGISGKVFVIWLAAFVPCVLNSYAGVKYTDNSLIDVARAFGASNWETFIKVGIPWSLPMVFTGMRVSLGSAWMSSVAAELLAANVGLGYMMQNARMFGRPDIIIIGMLTIGLLGALMAIILSVIEKSFTKRWN